MRFERCPRRQRNYNEQILSRPPDHDRRAAIDASFKSVVRGGAAETSPAFAKSLIKWYLDDTDDLGYAIKRATAFRLLKLSAREQCAMTAQAIALSNGKAAKR
jgi:hypothetical protein